MYQDILLLIWGILLIVVNVANYMVFKNASPFLIIGLVGGILLVTISLMNLL